MRSGAQCLSATAPVVLFVDTGITHPASWKPRTNPTTTCHVGGGASLMGTTSGDGRIRVALGRDCLIGANAGVGIALGDGCVVEAGCYVTAGSQVTTPEGHVVKATELSGRPRLLFRRNSLSGRLEAVPTKGFSGLNASLHATDISNWSPDAMLLR